MEYRILGNTGLSVSVIALGCEGFMGKTEETYDSLAMCDEKAMEEYLESEKIEEDTIAEIIGNRKAYPCYFGSALKMEGVQEFMEGMRRLRSRQICFRIW